MKKTNMKKACFFAVAFLMVLSIENVFSQSFGSVRALIDSQLLGHHEIVSISDESEEANESVRQMTRGQYYDPSRIVVWGFRASSNPLSPGLYMAHRGRITGEIGRSLGSLAESWIYDHYSFLGDIDEAEAMKFYTLVVSKNIVESQRVEFEVWARSRHQVDGSHHYYVFTFVSALKPTVEDVLNAASASPGTHDSRRAAAPPSQNAAQDKLDLSAIVNSFFEDSDFQAIRSRFNSYWEN